MRELHPGMNVSTSYLEDKGLEQRHLVPTWVQLLCIKDLSNAQAQNGKIFAEAEAQLSNYFYTRTARYLGNGRITPA
jgi:hypothetical protein